MAPDQHLPWFEKLMRDAQEAGEFDDLKGAGRPIEDIDRFYEAGWWAKRFIERERLNDAAAELAAAIREGLPRLLAKRDDVTVRTGLAEFNDRIAEVNLRLKPEDRLDPLDIEALMAQRAGRHFSDNS